MLIRNMNRETLREITMTILELLLVLALVV